jgi:hypothetical protein
MLVNFLKHSFQAKALTNRTILNILQKNPKNSFFPSLFNEEGCPPMAA